MGFSKSPDSNKIVPEPHQVPIAVLEPLFSDGEEDIVQEEEGRIGPEDYQPRRAHGGRSQAVRRQMVLQALEDSSCRSCKVGRRWSRRHDNGAFLKGLLNQNEEEVDNIHPQEPTIFGKLMCDDNAMKIWEKFTSQPEEDQENFLKAMRKAKETAAKERTANPGKVKPAEGRKCFKKICPHIQEFLIDENMPKGTLLRLEPCLVDFFLSEPSGQFVCKPLPSDERKIIHGLAQYLDLKSQSFNTQLCLIGRCTKVTNTKPNFTAPPVLLSEFLGIC